MSASKHNDSHLKNNDEKAEEQQSVDASNKVVEEAPEVAQPVADTDESAEVQPEVELDKSEEKPEAVEEVGVTEDEQVSEAESESEPEPETEDKTKQEETVNELSQKIIGSHVAVKGKTHSKARQKKAKKEGGKQLWRSILVGAGIALTVLIFVAGGFSRLYQGKALPNVYVAGLDSSAMTESQIQKQLQEQVGELKITLVAGKKTLSPSLKEIGYQVDTQKTIQAAVDAKRESVFKRFAFWQKTEVPAVVTVNDTLLNQYLETKLASMNKPSTDARLEFNPSTNTFVITKEKGGSGPDSQAAKSRLEASGQQLKSTKVTVETTDKPAKITSTKLQSLLAPANEYLTRSISLSGSTGTYQAGPADIALWVIPTPQKDGSIKLKIDPARVQSYVESIGRYISSPPQDKKVIKDKKTNKVVVLQEGRNGTELSDKQGLVNQITQAINDGQDVSAKMNIKTAAYKTVNLQGYDKWIEVDLSEQRTTAYEGATPVKSFIIASGMAGYETPVGEYAIWLKVRKQTMQGGSKADGSYYNLPNVEWVSYFYQDYALHGAYWRKVFGAPASHGCVNMTNADAMWVYNWAPVGTKVIVHT